MALSSLLLETGDHLLIKTEINADPVRLLLEPLAVGGGWPGFDPETFPGGYVMEDGRLKFKRHGR